MANLKNVIYLSNEDYATLLSTGTVTINGTTLTYDPDNVYVTPDNIQEVKTQSTGGATSVQLKIWVGTQAQYNSLLTNNQIDSTTQYIIIG